MLRVQIVGIEELIWVAIIIVRVHDDKNERIGIEQFDSIFVQADYKCVGQRRIEFERIELGPFVAG